MKKVSLIFYFFILLLLFFGCSANKYQIGKVKFDIGKLKKDVSEFDKLNAANYYSLALASLNENDPLGYFLNLNFAFMFYPASDSILNRFIPAMYSMSVITQNKSLCKEIIKISKWAQKNNIKNATLFFYTGMCFEDKKKINKAEKYYNLAIHIKPKIAYLIYYFKFLKNQKNKIDESIIKQALKLVENNPIKLLQVLNDFRKIEPEITLKYSKEYYEKYNDNENFLRLLLNNYLLLDNKKQVVKLISRQISANKKISDDIFVAFLKYLDITNTDIDTLNICDYKYFDEFALNTILDFYTFLYAKEKYKKLAYCYIKHDSTISKELTSDARKDYITLKLIAFTLTKDDRNLRSELNKNDNLIVERYEAIVFMKQYYPDISKNFLEKYISTIKNENLKHFYMSAVAYKNLEYEQAAEELKLIDKNFYSKNSGLNLYIAARCWDFTKDEEETYNMLVSTNDSLSVNYYMSMIMVYAENYERAIEYVFKDTVKTYLPQKELFSIFDYIYNIPEYYEKFVKVLLKYLPHYENDPFYLNALGYFIVENNMKKYFDIAKELLIKANELDRGNYYLIDSLGWYYYQVGDYEKAFDWFSKINPNEIDQSEIMYHFGMLYIKLNKINEAKNFFKKAVQFNTDKKYVSLSQQKLNELDEKNN